MKTSALILLSSLIAASAVAQARQLPANPVGTAPAPAAQAPSDQAGIADSTNAKAQLAHARELMGKRRYEEARDVLERVVRDNPDYAKALLSLAQVSMYLDQRSAGEAYFIRFHRLMETSPQYQRGPMLLVLARLASQRGDAATALGWLEKIELGDKENFMSAQVQRANLLVKKGDLEGARLLLSSYKSDEPTAQAQLLLAEAYLVHKAGKTEEALALLAQGRQRYPGNAALLYEYASLAHKTGRAELAESTLRAYVALHPDSYEGLNALGYFLAEHNLKLDEAKQFLTRALALAPERAAVLDSLGWVEYRLGNLAQAEIYLRRAKAAGPSTDIGVHLAEVLWQRGDKDGARMLLRDARAEDPSSEALADTLARLKVTL